MNRLFGLIGVATAGLALSGCGSKAQQEVDQQARAVDKSYEAQAAATEAAALGGPNEDAARNQAEALRNQGEQIKDHLINEAKELNKVPKK